MSILDHVTLVVSDYARSKAFYEKALAPLGSAEVHEFHAAAIAAGGKDFGAPGLRPEYHAKYYGSFVIDPDGHDVEAVIHGDSANLVFSRGANTHDDLSRTRRRTELACSHSSRQA